MKTYHVFIASSLSFQKERDLMEKVLTERNNSELNIVVHRHEKNGDNDLAKGDTQEIINSEIRQCDVIIFFAGNWIRSKTIGEFNVAIENASNKHIYFYQNPTLEYTQEDWTNTTLWKDFYAEYMQKHLDDDTVIERYEKQCNTLEQLRDALVKDRESFLNNPFCAISCHKMEYDKIIPNSQANRRRGNLDYYFIRPEVDNKLKEEFDHRHRAIHFGKDYCRLPNAEKAPSGILCGHFECRYDQRTVRTAFCIPIPAWQKNSSTGRFAAVVLERRE